MISVSSKLYKIWKGNSHFVAVEDHAVVNDFAGISQIGFVWISNINEHSMNLEPSDLWVGRIKPLSLELRFIIPKIYPQTTQNNPACRNFLYFHHRTLRSHHEIYLNHFLPRISEFIKHKKFLRWTRGEQTTARCRATSRSRLHFFFWPAKDVSAFYYNFTVVTFILVFCFFQLCKLLWVLHFFSP